MKKARASQLAWQSGHLPDGRRLPWTFRLYAWLTSKMGIHHGRREMRNPEPTPELRAAADRLVAGMAEFYNGKNRSLGTKLLAWTCRMTSVHVLDLVCLRSIIRERMRRVISFLLPRP